MTKNMQLDDITTLDADKCVAVHPKSGVIVSWPKPPEDLPADVTVRLSTIFRLTYELQVLEFRTRWELRQTGVAKTLICQPYIDDGIERSPEQDPLHNLIEQVYVCLWRYANHMKIDETQQFALTYANKIYTGGIEQTIPMPNS